MSNNIFKDAKGEHLTQRIGTGDVESTVNFLEKITGLDFTEEKADDGKPKKWLGSTGRKENPDGTFELNSSGDLDLSVDLNEVSKEQVIAKLVAWCKSQGIEQDDIMNVSAGDIRKKTGDKTAPKKKDGWIEKAGDQIHFRTPINGDGKNGYVQADFMFTDNPSYQQGSMIGDPGGTWKGEHRHILLSSIARAKNLKYSPKFGLLDPDSNEVISNDWNVITKELLGQTATIKDIKTVDSIINYIKKLPNYEELVSAARETLDKQGLELPTKEAFESYKPGSIGWMRSMIDLVK